MTKRIITIVGARPQFIKAATISRILKTHEKIKEILIHTGQHHDENMSDIFFDELQIPRPSYFLGIQGGTHGQMTGRMVEALENVLLKENPDTVLVYGDTNSTLAGALSASKLHIPIIHVEAGLRSYNRLMPEEVNRVLVDHLSSLLFCPTKAAIANLAKEGISKSVYHTGDIMYDATLFAIEVIKNNQELGHKFSNATGDFGLLTVHRTESTQSQDILRNILEYVASVSLENHLKVIFPVHPRTRRLIQNMERLIPENFQLIDPLSYLEIQFLLTRANCVFTDSGGLQKEAYFHQIPCITLRSETEWVETIEAGWNKLWKMESYRERKNIDDYGSGDASSKILQIIMDYL